MWSSVSIGGAALTFFLFFGGAKWSRFEALNLLASFNWYRYTKRKLSSVVNFRHASIWNKIVIEKQYIHSPHVSKLYEYLWDVKTQGKWRLIRLATGRCFFVAISYESLRICFVVMLRGWKLQLLSMRAISFFCQLFKVLGYVFSGLCKSNFFRVRMAKNIQISKLD